MFQTMLVQYFLYLMLYDSNNAGTVLSVNNAGTVLSVFNVVWFGIKFKEYKGIIIMADMLKWTNYKMCFDSANSEESLAMLQRSVLCPCIYFDNWLSSKVDAKGYV